MRRVAGLGVSDGIAIDIDSDRQSAGFRDVFGSGHADCGGGWRVVDRRDGNADGVGIAAAIAVGNGIAECVGAVVVGHRRVHVRAVGGNGDAAVRRIAGLGVGDGIAVDIDRDRQAAGFGDVFGGGHADCGGHRCVVDRCDGDAHGVGIAAATTVADAVTENVGAVVVGGRGVRVAAVGTNRHAAMRRIAGFGIGNRVAVGVSGDGQAAIPDGVFRRADAGRRSHRCPVAGGDSDADGLFARIAGDIGGDHGKGVAGLGSGVQVAAGERHGAA